MSSPDGCPLWCMLLRHWEYGKQVYPNGPNYYPYYPWGYIRQFSLKETPL